MVEVDRQPERPTVCQLWRALQAQLTRMQEGSEGSAASIAELVVLSAIAGFPSGSF